MTDSYQRGNNLPERRSGTGEHLRPPNPNLPPHPLDAEWWLHIEGKTYGPFSGHKIREYVEDGRVGTATSTLRAGSENWQRAIDDPILGALFDPRRLARKPQTTNVSAKDGATVVQVTNTIAPHPVVFLDDGPAQPKPAGFALFLSLLICGVGQMYNGQVAKGILMLIGCAALWIALLGWVIWIWSMVDAYQTAKAMNLRYQRRLAASAISGDH
jgi:TM2 domain-containing membrane protein YozV